MIDRNKWRVTLAVLYVCLGSMVAAQEKAAAPTVLAPGLWEITIRTESPVAAQPMTTVVCLTKEEAEKPAPPKSKAKDDCKVISGGLAGNVLSYVARCSKSDVTSTSRFTFSGDRYEGVIEINVDGRDVRQTISGRHLGGQCEDEDEGAKP